MKSKSNYMNIHFLPDLEKRMDSLKLWKGQSASMIQLFKTIEVFEVELKWKFSANAPYINFIGQLEKKENIQGKKSTMWIIKKSANSLK